MSSRPRRSSLKQKDASVDMLGLSRQEERMLQRAMYDSLRQQSQKGPIKHQLLKNRDNSITTRSKSLTKLLISVPETIKSTFDSTTNTSHCSLSTTMKPAVEQQKLKRGTRYSPMRKLPLSEMLKSLEDKKNRFNNDRSYSNMTYKLPTVTNMKRHSPVVKKEVVTAKQPKLMNQDVVVRKPGRPKIIRTESTHCSQIVKEMIISTRTSEKSAHMSPKPKRTPRTASLVARSSWISQNSSASSPNRSPIKMSPLEGNTYIERVRFKSMKPKQEKSVEKPKKFLYNRKTISHSQRISRVILANATQRFKKAKIKEKNEEKSSHRLASKMKSAKINQDPKTTAVIPPELWLDPRGQPVDTEDFINFLIYRDTPYLDKSLKWFALPPHKRKQRLYKIVPMENAKFNETIVYNEKKDVGGREIVVHCQPPKLNDDDSELVSLDSEQTSLPDDNKIKCPASVNSSCVTQAAVDEELSPIRRLTNGDCAIGEKAVVDRRRSCNKIKSPLKSDSKSTHIMEIRKRKT